MDQKGAPPPVRKLFENYPKTEEVGIWGERAMGQRHVEIIVFCS